MQHTTTMKTQEPSLVLDYVSQLGRFAFESKFQSLGFDSQASSLSNFLYFKSVGGVVNGRKRRPVNSLRLGGRGSFSFRKFFSDFNRAVRFHCEKIPIGFASLRIDSGDNGSSNNNGTREDGCAVLEDDRLQLNGVETETPKKVLILMSDTGGGHRASAEAIKAAFHEEFGDDYQVCFSTCL